MSLDLSLPRVDALTVSKLLRKAVIDRTVLGLKAAFAAISILCLIIAVRSVLLSLLTLRADIADLESARNSAANAPSEASEKIVPDYQVLVKQPLVSLQPQTKPQVKPTVQPTSTLSLALIGTFIAGTKEPYAIIEDKKKSNQEVFIVGETIFGEAKLKAVHSDYVEIERNSQTERLVLDEFSDGKSDAKGGVAVAEGNLYVVDESEIDKALENLPLLLTQARAVPYFKDGVAVGLRLFAIKSDSIFEKIGLKNGDILKSVNGNNLGDLTQAMKLFETLKQERSLGLRLERNMEEKEFRYEIR